MTDSRFPSEYDCWVLVPPGQLSAEALRGVVEAFIAREGTDYGAVERSFADKVAQVEAALRRGDANVVFDPLTESCTIIARRELPQALD